jgi:glycine cleavage system aminomethyltransferase T
MCCFTRSGWRLVRGMQVEIEEPDVSPLAVQGPKAEDLMARIFGDGIREVGFFKFARFDVRRHLTDHCPVRLFPAGRIRDLP